VSDFEWGTAAQWFSPMVAIAISIWAALSRRGEKAFDELKQTVTEAIEALRGEDARIFNRLDAVESRCSSIEAELRHLPSKDAMHNLEKSLLKMEGKIDVISAKVEPIKAISDRIQENMMEHAK